MMWTSCVFTTRRFFVELTVFQNLCVRVHLFILLLKTQSGYEQEKG